MENQTYSTKLLGVLHGLFQILKSFLMIFTVSPREVKTSNCHCQIIVALVIQVPLTWILYTVTLFDCFMVFLHMHITCVSYREGRLHIFTFANITWSIALKLCPNVTSNRLGIRLVLWKISLSYSETIIIIKSYIWRPFLFLWASTRLPIL